MNTVIRNAFAAALGGVIAFLVIQQLQKKGVVGG